MYGVCSIRRTAVCGFPILNSDAYVYDPESPTKICSMDLHLPTPIFELKKVISWEKKWDANLVALDNPIELLSW